MGEDLPGDPRPPVCRACLRAARKQVGTGRLNDRNDLHCPAAARAHEGIYLIDLADCCFR